MKRFMLFLLFAVLSGPLYSQTTEDLMDAAAFGDIPAIERILKSGKVDVDERVNYIGMTALMIGAANGNIDVVVKLKELGSDVNARNNTGMTALMFAATKGDSDMVVKLVELGADVNAEDDYGATALSLAKAKEHMNTVEKLKELGAVE